MPRLLGKNSRNPWLDQDRQDQRRIVFTAVIFTLVVLGGMALLVYALLQA